MPALVMVSETTGQEWRIWPDPEPFAPGLVHETGSYLFELRDSALAATADLAIDDISLEALRAPNTQMARWRWLPGFYAGSVEAELRFQGASPRRFEIITDPDRRKLARGEFDVMVQEILSDTFALFSLTGFRKGIARGLAGKPPAIARLEFLRSRIDELETVIAAINRNPRRRLAAKNAVLPYHRAIRATGAEILRSFRSGRVLSEASSEPSRLPVPLRGLLPEHIQIRQRVGSLDIPEHRQMRACLWFWAEWLNTAAEQIERFSVAADVEFRRNASAWPRRCRRLAKRIGLLTAAPPFAEAVGDAPAHLTISAIFRNDPSYRRFYKLWQDMNLGIAAIFGDYLNLPLARTFELYELWCFLRLVRAAAEEFGPTGVETKDLFIVTNAGSVTLANGSVTVPVGSGVKLCFQKQYREFWVEADGRGSYSRTMVPDVVLLTDPTGTSELERLIVFDAKYRIENGLNEALNSIHTYRDALVREAESGAIEGIVKASYLLSPMIQEMKADKYRETALPGRLFHPEYRAQFRFGAVTMRPGMSLEDVRGVLRTVIADSAAGAP